MNGAIEFWNRAAAAWWDWTVTTTWHGALLLALIASVLVAMKSLRPGIRYGLLLVVLLKLAMPPVLRLSYGFSDLLAQMTAVPVTVSEPTSMSISVGPGTLDFSEGVQATDVLRMPMAVPEITSWILLLQLVGAAAIGALILRHVMETWKIKRATPPAGDALQSQLLKVAAHMGLRHVPALYVSPQVNGPQSGGILRPFILLPEWAAAMSAAEREILLAHEVAHVLRRDALVNAFQAMAQALLWWNPLVWWVNRRIREEREYCCDDLVVGRGVAHGHAYARTLVDVAERVALPRSSWAMVGMADAYHVLDRRVRRALDEPRTVWPGARYAGLVALALVAGWVLPGNSDGVEEIVASETTATSTSSLTTNETGQPSEQFSMRVNAGVMVGNSATGKLEGIRDGSLVIVKTGVADLNLEGSSLHIDHADMPQTIRIEGDIRATALESTFLAEGVIYHEEGIAEFHGVTMDGPGGTIKAEKMRFDLSDGSFEMERASAPSLKLASPSTTSAESGVETRKHQNGVEDISSEDPGWVQRTYNGYAYFEKVSGDDSADEESLTLAQVADESEKVKAEVVEKVAIEIRTSIIELDQSIELELPNPYMHVSEDLTPDGDELPEPRPFLAGTASEAEWVVWEGKLEDFVDAGQAKKLGSPGLTVLAGEEATISIGSNVPFEKEGETASKFVGLTLGIVATPVGSDGEISVQLEYRRTTQSGVDDSNPIFSTRSVKGTLLVKGGEWGYFLLLEPGERRSLVAFQAALVQSAAKS